MLVKWINFCTIYKYHIKNRKAGDNYYKNFRVNACFAYVRSDYYNDDQIEMSIKIYTDLTKLKQSADNYCPLNAKEAYNVIRSIKKIIDFKFNVKEFDNYFVVNLKYCGRRTGFLFILTWIRYLYEHPYNFIMYHAYKLCEQKRFPFESIYNLFMTVASTSKEFDYGHGITRSGNLMTKKQLKDRLNHVDRLNSIHNDISERKLVSKLWSLETDDLNIENVNKNMDMYIHNYLKLKNG